MVKVQKQQLRAKEKLAKQSQAALGQLELRHAELQSAARELTTQQDHQQAQRCNPQRHAYADTFYNLHQSLFHEFVAG